MVKEADLLVLMILETGGQPVVSLLAAVSEHYYTQVNRRFPIFIACLHILSISYFFLTSMLRHASVLRSNSASFVVAFGDTAEYFYAVSGNAR